MTAFPDVARDDIQNGLLDWLQFSTHSRRKIICRHRTSRNRMAAETALALRVARGLQDRGLISILTRREGDTLAFIAERAL